MSNICRAKLAGETSNINAVTKPYFSTLFSTFFCDMYTLSCKYFGE